ncbi:hypothetical protein GTA08_BOTSDO10079 [Neofusicoccum parvum]|uniref:Uncharacterized protein n=1 Tax=Neofusicoccum parvum TaxID=310453 RepID=A0ACB5S1D8_9PEZI|nr:hypothetical protein GTA08_BOTSDO10079 [Neofusicoccum parvum]
MDDTPTPSMTLYTAVRHLCLSTGSPATKARAKAVARAAGYDAFAATVALVEADHRRTHRTPAPPRPQTPEAHDALPPRPAVSPSTPDAPWSTHAPPPPSAYPNAEAFTAFAPPPSPKNNSNSSSSSTDDNPTLPLLIRPAPGEPRPNHAKPIQRTRLWVGGVPAGTTERELRGAFGWFGNVASAGEYGGRGEVGGVGSVVFVHRVDAEAARRAVEAGEVVVGGAVVAVGRGCEAGGGDVMDVDG